MSPVLEITEELASSPANVTPGLGSHEGPPLKSYPPPNPDGFSDPDDFAATDTIRIYVDAAAVDDSANGLDPSTPKKTYSAGRALIRPGHADQLLLNCDGEYVVTNGTYWTVDGTAGAACLSGRSRNERTVLGSYGTGAPPILKTGTKSCFTTSAMHSLDNFAMLGVDLWCDGWVPSMVIGGVEIGGGCNDILFEGNVFRRSRFEFHIKGITAKPPRTNVVIRRNTFLDAKGFSANHITIWRVADLLIEENQFHGMEHQLTGIAVAWGHSVMVTWDSSRVIVRDNVFSGAANKAIWLACGGVVHGNVAIQCGGGIQVGNSYNSNDGLHARPGGVPCSVIGNLAIELRDIVADDGNVSGGDAIVLENIVNGEVAQNLVTQSTVAQNPTWVATTIKVKGTGNTMAGVPTLCKNVIIRDNKLVRAMSGNGGSDAGIGLEGINTGSLKRLENIQLLNNDVQEPISDVGFLVRIQSSGTYPEISSAGNRFWRGGTAAAWFQLGGNQYRFAGMPSYQSLLGDTSSQAIEVPYQGATRTIGDYMLSLGLAGTTADFILQCRAQTRATWNLAFGAAAVIDYFNGNLSYTAPTGDHHVGQTLDEYPVSDQVGWTTFTPTPGSTVIWYVDDQAAPGGNGLTEGAAFQTFSAAKAAADAYASTHGYACDNWILLKSGRVFAPPANNNLRGNRGISITRPFLIGTWGPNPGDKNVGPRATVRAPTPAAGQTATCLSIGGGGGGALPTDASNIAIFNLAFDCPTYNGANFEAKGFECVHRATNLLIEGCKFTKFTDNVILMGAGTDPSLRLLNPRFRRNVSVDAKSSGAPNHINGKSQGLYASETDGLLIEGCFFGHNGWDAAEPAFWNIFAHNVYCQNTTWNTLVRHNIFADANSHAIQMRGGGSLRHNLFLRNPIVATLGGGSDVNPVMVSFEAYGNVILEGRNTRPAGTWSGVDPGELRGWGFGFSNIQGATLAYNLFLKNTLGGQAKALTFAGRDPLNPGCFNVNAHHNIFYEWKTQTNVLIEVLGTSAELLGNQFNDNDIVNSLEAGATFVGHEDLGSHQASRFAANNNKVWRTQGNALWFVLPTGLVDLTTWAAPLGNGNVAFNQTPTYTDVARNMATYMTSIAGAPATLDGFLAAARLQSVDAWDPLYTAGDVVGAPGSQTDESALLDYLRGGWDLVVP